MKNSFLYLLFSFVFIISFSCKSITPDNDDEPIDKEENPTDTSKVFSCDLNFNYTHQKGCDGKEYPNPKTSKYILPFPEGTVVKTGLTNCSSSYHGAGYPDRYAFDFNKPVGTKYYACRGGKVVLVIDDQPSDGGGEKYGNWVIIDHGDKTYGIYLHSPRYGISVAEGDTVKQGDLLGKVGKSGLAGYPHLHFIVVQNGYEWPYDPIPITFKNVSPADVILKSNTDYKVCKL